MGNVAQPNEWSDDANYNGDNDFNFYSTALQNDLQSMWNEMQTSFDEIEKDLHTTYNKYLPKSICELQAVTDNVIVIKFSNNDLLRWLGCTIQINRTIVQDKDIISQDNQVLITNVRSYIYSDIKPIYANRCYLADYRYMYQLYTESLLADITGGVMQTKRYELNEDMRDSLEIRANYGKCKRDFVTDWTDPIKFKLCHQQPIAKDICGILINGYVNEQIMIFFNDKIIFPIDIISICLAFYYLSTFYNEPTDARGRGSNVSTLPIGLLPPVCDGAVYGGYSMREDLREEMNQEDRMYLRSLAKSLR